MYISEEEINEVLSQYNIKEVIEKYVKLKKVDSKWIGRCPFHQESSPSFLVDEESQRYMCFGCGKGGNLLEFLMRITGNSFLEVLSSLSKQTYVLPDTFVREKENLYQMNAFAVEFFQKDLNKKAAQNFIAKRNLSEEMIEKFKLGYADGYRTKLLHQLKNQGYKVEEIEVSGLVSCYESITDKFKDRFMFPIQDINHRIIGFGGRLTNDAKKEKGCPKYLNSPETRVFDKSSNLYGLNFAKNTKEKEFILCEGYMDVIAMHQIGYANAVASLGTALTRKQVDLLSRYKKRIIVAYDMDGPGIAAAKRAMELLKEKKMGIRFLDMTPYKDPDEFIKAEGIDAFKERVEHADHKNNWILKQVNKSKDYSLLEYLEQSFIL